MEIWDTVIIGAGPAGLTSAIYAGRSQLKTLLMERLAPGGQIAATELVENYPGFPEGIMGADLAANMHEQARKFGARIEHDEIQSVATAGANIEVKGAAQTHMARTVILAMGTQPRMIDIPGEAEFFGRGVSTCATCDAPLHRGHEVAVIGGGDSAIQESLFLARFCSKVHVIHRRDQLRAVPILGDKAKSTPNIEIHWDTIPLAILGEQGVDAIRLKNVKTDAESDLPVHGVFLFIGLLPNTDAVKGLDLELDDKGFIVTDDRLATSVPGVFAAGDIRSKTQRQLATAVGDGAQSVFSVERYLES